jgi:hypothetical protein
MDRNSAHQAIDATYTPFERDGRVFIQIDTYGRVTRQDVGSKSQSFQLDREGAIELFKILRREFQLQ